MNMLASVNYLTVVVAALIPMVLGMVWYGPLFGKQWMDAMGIKKSDMGKMKKEAPKAYSGSFIAALVMSFVLGQVVNFFNASSASEGMRIGFWLWLGFIVTKSATDMFFGTGKNWTVYYLSMGYQLVSMLGMSALFAVWK